MRVLPSTLAPHDAGEAAPGRSTGVYCVPVMAKSPISARTKWWLRGKGAVNTVTPNTIMIPKIDSSNPSLFSCQPDLSGLPLLDGFLDWSQVHQPWPEKRRNMPDRAGCDLETDGMTQYSTPLHLCLICLFGALLTPTTQPSVPTPEAKVCVRCVPRFC